MSDSRSSTGRLLGACAGLTLLAGCGGHRESAPSTLPLLTGYASSRPGAGLRAASPIQHVIVVMQENRSFDNLFQGYPGADTAPSGRDSRGKTIRLRPISLAAPYDIDHTSYAFFAAYDNGKMDGFDQEGVYGRHPGNAQYGYVPHNQSKLYFEMAGQYVLGDRMFTSHIDASFVSHQYIIAGQAEHAVDLPGNDWGCDGSPRDRVATLKPDRSYGPYEKPCFKSQTLGDELDAAGLPWRFYASGAEDIWSAYHAVRHIRFGKDWNNVIAPSPQFLTDVQNGDLAAVTWITPEWQDSDHGGASSTSGPEWIANIVNTVGESQFWDSTAIFVMWDEWGGWYDHVAPPFVDYDGLGMRVPLLIISPYAKQGYVSHVQYEHGSILRYIEDVWGLGQLAPSDTRANDPAVDCFDYTQKPRPFKPFETRMKSRDFMNRPHVALPPGAD